MSKDSLQELCDSLLNEANYEGECSQKDILLLIAELIHKLPN